VTWGRRAAILAALACAGTVPFAVAVPALTARDNGGDPPTVRGPLAFKGQRCFQKGPGYTCAFDYLLDRSATDDPADEWHAFWVSSQAAEPARHGFCTTEVVESVVWATTAMAARTSPPAGTSEAGPDVGAHLAVDAAGHAHVAASLDQTPDWRRGLVTTTAQGGRMTVLWQGATTRGMSLAFGSEVVNPGSSPTSFGGDQYEVGVPCAHVGSPGPGFAARIKPAVSARRRPAYVQVRIPGTHIKPGPVIRPGRATIRIGSGRPVTLEVVGRAALALPAHQYGLYAGRYVVRVVLRGPTGTRRYRLQLRVR
jgi:hypothetical protein